MLVKFAALCDAPRGPEYRGELGGRCAKRSREYTEWPHCRICDTAVCPDHQRAGTVRATSLDYDCICLECEDDGKAR